MTATTSTPPPPPPPPPPTAPRPPLSRTPYDKVVSGLCGGLGRHFAVDPLVFRVGFVVLSLVGGTGFFLYAAGWLLVPDDRTGVSHVQRWFSGNWAAKVVGVVIIGPGVLLLLGGVGTDFGEFGTGFVLIAVGVAVLVARRRTLDAGDAPEDGRASPADAPGPVVVPPPPALGSSSPDATAPIPPPPTIPMSAVPPEPPPPRPPRPPSVLPAVTMSLLAILTGGLIALDAGGVFDVSVQTGLALALLVVGAALVVGAWWGRAWSMIPVGIVLSGALFLVAIIDVPLKGGVGDRSYRPASAAELRSPYRLVAGEMVLDLRRVDVTGTRMVVATVGAGELVVVVPPDVTVSVDASAGAGEVSVQGQTWDGLDVDRHATLVGPEGGGRLRLEARAGMGRVEVRRAAA